MNAYERVMGILKEIRIQCFISKKHKLEFYMLASAEATVTYNR